jgi:hypothetical protein
MSRENLLKIYVAAVEALGRKEVKTQWYLVYHTKKMVKYLQVSVYKVDHNAYQKNSNMQLLYISMVLNLFHKKSYNRLEMLLSLCQEFFHES